MAYSKAQFIAAGRSCFIDRDDPNISELLTGLAPGEQTFALNRERDRLPRQLFRDGAASIDRSVSVDLKSYR